MRSVMDHAHSAHAAPPDGVTPEKDPVCGMTVVPGRAKGGSAEHDGHTYWFCNPKCRDRFVADPAKYLAPKPAPAPATVPPPPTPAPVAAPLVAAADATIYTCPMHPEIRQRGPGACPKCGMALEPALPTVEDTANPELVDMTRRLWIAVALTAPVFALAMAEMAGVDVLESGVRAWIELALAAPVVAWCGSPFFARGWASIRHRSLNMFTLIAIGTGAAFGYSVLATVVPSIIPMTMRGLRR